MKCFMCEISAPENTLYRVNAKGRPPIWACKAHRIEPDMDLDVTIDEIERMRRLHKQVIRKASGAGAGEMEGGKS